MTDRYQAEVAPTNHSLTPNKIMLSHNPARSI